MAHPVYIYFGRYMLYVRATLAIRNLLFTFCRTFWTERPALYVNVINVNTNHFHKLHGIFSRGGMILVMWMCICKNWKINVFSYTHINTLFRSFRIIIWKLSPFHRHIVSHKVWRLEWIHPKNSRRSATFFATLVQKALN